MRLRKELAYMSATELAIRIRDHELSPVEVFEAFVERIEERNKSLTALIYFGYEDAKRRARDAEHVLMSGEKIGLFHGVPTVTKDVSDSRPGWLSTFGGVRALKHNLADGLSLFTERMEKAGAIVLGETNSATLGFSATTDNYLFGPSRNPFNTSKNTGGSSGGSAAAVADGLIPIAEGSDGGGSIRNPAAWCGLYGYKASPGRVPLVTRPNAFKSSIPFVTRGTLTRTVEDAVLGLNALTGFDARDPLSLDENLDFSSATHRSIKGWRIAYSRDFDVFPIARDVSAVVTEAVEAFSEAGAHIEEVKLGITRDQKELSNVWCRLIISQTLEFFEIFRERGIDLLKDHRDDFPPHLIEWVTKGYEMNVRALMRDQQVRTEVYDAIQRVFENYDLLVTPTLSCSPVDNTNDGNTMGPTDIDGVAVNPIIGWCLTYMTNLSGHPSASIPAGLTGDRLPVGMQIIGSRYSDMDVLSASAVFERLRPWNDIYEICENRPI